MKKSEEIYSYIEMLVAESKKRPEMYGEVPNELELMWYWLDNIKFFILNKDDFSYSMNNYSSENNLGNFGFVSYLKKRENLKDNDLIFKKLVELRNDYEIWAENKLLKDSPSLKEIIHKIKP